MIKIQRHEEDAKIVNMHLESNVQVLKSLEKFYEDLSKREEETLIQDCTGDIRSFIRLVHEIINDLILETKRASLLIRITSDRKLLITQRLQAQSTAKAERLNNSMFSFSYMAQKETIAMRVMAAVTILYLPATFVSTFFSTDVVKYQNQPQGNNDIGTTGAGTFDKNYSGTFSNTAIIRWLTLTIPLTLITVIIGLGYYFSEKRKRDEEMPKLDLEQGMNGTVRH
jgi:hypothetical protein